ncbi:MAG: hypothetical protein JW870_04895 [Candidatus Delongbacteria bacterium]|nr:hypothetical protein [Candidatus Delongbacteria bacterium]
MNIYDKFSFTKISFPKVYVWIKKKVRAGFFPEFENYTDQELLYLARAVTPIISIQMLTAGRLAQEQLERKNKLRKAVPINLPLQSC